MYRHTTDAGTHHLFGDDAVQGARGGRTATSLCGTVEAHGPFVHTEADNVAGPEDTWCENCLNAIEEDA